MDELRAGSDKAAEAEGSELDTAKEDGSAPTTAEEEKEEEGSTDDGIADASGTDEEPDE